MWRDCFYFSNDDTLERGGDWRDLLDFKSSHRQGMRNLIDRHLSIDKFLQPVYGNSHLCILLAELTEKFHIVLKEEPQIIHAILQHG